MRALVKSGGRVAVVDRPAPTLDLPDQVRVAITRAGICRTDVYVATSELGGPGPLVLGHEAAGRVLEVGAAVTDLEVGAQVAIAPAAGCGACPSCEDGQPLACPRRRMLGLELGGVFAEQVILPRSMLFEVPAALDARRAAYAEPVAAALGAAEAPISKGARVLVLGDNRIARLTALVLEAVGFERVERGAPEGEGAYDAVVETSPEALGLALIAVRPRGHLVLKSRPASPVALPLELAVRKQVSLHARSYGRFEAALDLLPRLALDPLFGVVHPLEDFEAAFAETLEAPVKTFFEPKAG